MKCKTIQNLLCLNKPGELSPGILAKIQKHIRTCDVCASESKKYDDAEIFIDKLRIKRPVLINPEKMTQNIITEIENLKHPAAGENRGNLFDFILDSLFLPKVRFTLILLLFLIIGSFLAQESSTLYNITKLEERMDIQTAGNISLTGNLPENLGLLDALGDVYRLIAGKKELIELPGDWILIKRDSLDHLIQFYTQTYGSKKSLFEGINLQGKLLKSDLAKNDFVKQELRQLLKNKKILVKELKNYY